MLGPRNSDHLNGVWPLLTFQNVVLITWLIHYHAPEWRSKFFARFVISQEVDLLITSRPLYPSKDSILRKTTQLLLHAPGSVLTSILYVHACLSVTFKLSIRSEITSWSRRQIKANSSRGKKRPGKKYWTHKRTNQYCYVFFFVWELLDKKFSTPTKKRIKLYSFAFIVRPPT